jgi:adenine specific DNA methylase Mod
MGGQLCQEKKKNLLTQAIEKSSLAGSQFFSNHNANQPINENQIETLQAQVQFVLEKFSAFSAEHPLQSIKTADIHPSKVHIFKPF